jgi:hypothetical protein
MAMQAAQDAGLTAACHIEGGLEAWKKNIGSHRKPPTRPL